VFFMFCESFNVFLCFVSHIMCSVLFCESFNVFCFMSLCCLCSWPYGLLCQHINNKDFNNNNNNNNFYYYCISKKDFFKAANVTIVSDTLNEGMILNFRVSVCTAAL
jgi:hypothetical protein